MTTVELTDWTKLTDTLYAAYIPVAFVSDLGTRVYYYVCHQYSILDRGPMLAPKPYS